jgi:hypothetical protein
MTVNLPNNQNGPLGFNIDGFTYPQFISANRAPTSNDIYNPGTRWLDASVSPHLIYETSGSGDWDTGGVQPATTTTYGTVLLTDNSEPVATKTYADNLVASGAPIATSSSAGISQLASNTKAVNGTDGGSTLLDPPNVVIPSNLTAKMSAPGTIGNVTPAAATFTDLTANGTGTVSLGANAASNFTVTGAFDLTLATTAGSIPISAGEAAADAISIQAAAGGLDVDTALLLSLRSSRNNASAIEIVASAGGIDISAVGTAGEDIDILATGSSVNITATENVADSIVISSSNGGIDITAAAASAGEDIDISAVGSSVNISSTENAALAITLNTNGGTSETIRIRNQQGTNAASVDISSTAGGLTLTGGLGTADAINIVASDTAGGIDIDAGTGGIAADTTGSVVVTSTANSAASIFMHANGGTSETIRLHADQGTAVTSLDLLSDVGGITLRAGLGNADAINITATAAGGGIDVDAGTAGFIVDTTGAISLDSAAASNLTVTGAFDLTVNTTAGSLNLTAGEDAADAIVISASAGGIDILATGAATQDIDIVNTGGSVNISATENDAGAITIGTNGGTSERITVTCAQGTNASSIALTSTAGGLTLTGGLGTADAINLVATTAGGGIDIDSSTGGIIVDTTGAISLDSALASNLTVTGAADLTVNSTAGALNLTSGEANADSILITSAGGAQLTATGAAAKDVLITCTSGSMTLSAGENVTDAMNVTASGAASRVNITAGTGSIKFASGWIVPVTTKANADTPYTILGTDYLINCDTSAGVLQVTLPAANAVAGRTYVIRDGIGNAAINNITINGGGTNLVGGGAAAATKVLSAAYSGATVYSNGTVWLYSYVA